MQYTDASFKLCIYYVIICVFINCVFIVYLLCIFCVLIVYLLCIYFLFLFSVKWRNDHRMKLVHDVFQRNLKIITNRTDGFNFVGNKGTNAACDVQRLYWN